MIATVRGWLTHDQGGRLESVETGVALLVPPRALPPGPAAHLVYFKVCRQDHVRSVDTNGVLLDDGKGTVFPLGTQQGCLGKLNQKLKTVARNNMYYVLHFLLFCFLSLFRVNHETICLCFFGGEDGLLTLQKKKKRLT